jgi:hypothetical protein
VDSGDDRSSTIGVGRHWALILGRASALIDTEPTGVRLAEVMTVTKADQQGFVPQGDGPWEELIGAEAGELGARSWGAKELGAGRGRKTGTGGVWENAL